MHRYTVLEHQIAAAEWIDVLLVPEHLGDAKPLPAIDLVVQCGPSTADRRVDHCLFLPEEVFELCGQALDERTDADDLHSVRGPRGWGEMERETRLELATLCLGSICSRFADRGPAELGGLPERKLQCSFRANTGWVGS